THSMKSAAPLLLLVVIGVVNAGSRVRRGFGGGGGGYGGGGYGGGGGFIGGYGGGAQVLLGSNGGAGYGSAGAASHVLNAAGGYFQPSTDYNTQSWYSNAALNAGDAYAAKTIGAGQFLITSADQAAASAIGGIFGAAQDPNIGNAVNYLTDHATAAGLSAASHHGAAAIVTS
ncbi:unnamed protein product, partial [Meganyctiphanes norvegica]